jgi:hypothetical protein
VCSIRTRAARVLDSPPPPVKGGDSGEDASSRARPLAVAVCPAASLTVTADGSRSLRLLFLPTVR